MRQAKVRGLAWQTIILPWLVLLLCLASLPALAAGSLSITYPFEEQLVPSGATSPQEDLDLTKAIKAYRGRSKPDDVQALGAFLSTHPHSAWSLALLTNIGLSDYHYGYFSRAIDDFDAAWRAGQSATEPHAKALADRAIGELLRMHGRLGHADDLATLLTETQDRGLFGSASAMRDGAKEGLWLMRNQPGVAYLCGPLALKALLQFTGTTRERTDFLNLYQSGPHGVTLAEVSRLADQAKLSHTLIHRDVGEPIPVPSIVHWKVHHFAAIIGQQGDRFHIEDPTFGPDLWVTRGALDSDASGYFLVPTAAGKPPVAHWKLATATEASQVYGMGVPNSSKDTALTPKDLCACNGSTTGQSSTIKPAMTVYDFKEMLVSLHLSDTPVGYTPAKGPAVLIQLDYNHREAHQPADPQFTSVSALWTLNFLSYIMDDPNQPGNSVMRFVGGGGESTQTGYSTSTQQFAPDIQDASVLSMVSTSTITYKRTLPDGSAEIYGQSDGATSSPRRVFLTEIDDPAGNALHLNYDSMLRLSTIVDATGRSTTFTYGLTGSPYLVTKITDPFKRSASFSYDGIGRLTDIIDVLGLDSHFTYSNSSSSFVQQLTTPYGTTVFDYGDNGNQRYLQATDPLGYTERLEFFFNETAPSSILNSDPVGKPAGMIGLQNQWLYYRDSFYWDKHGYAVAHGDYTKARQRHWAHLTDPESGSWEPITSDTLESIKYPLENRIWYTYPGQANLQLGAAQAGTYNQPTGIGRIMDDGSTQLTQTQYNAAGNVTMVTDPVGRQTQLTYAANQNDVTAIQQNAGSGFANVAQFPSYNTQHLPLSYVDAAGQTTRYTYYPNGLLYTVTDALGHKTTYIHNAAGDLTSIVDANNKTVLSLTYDGFDRVLTSTDSEGWAVQYAYDALDRVTTETYPDKTTRVFTYKYLDLYQVKDRQNRVTTYTHDANRRLTAVKDPLGNVTSFGYAENGTLTSLTDPNGHTTTWNIDLESRVTSKTYADGHGTGYGYEAATNRLLYVADQLNQIKQYSYTLDDRPAGITYYNSVNKTPNVAFTYDPYFPRLASMADGSGKTQYQYYNLGALGALQLAQETPPFANATIAYSYDKVGRLAARSVGGDVEQFGYDTLNRLQTHVDDLGTFTRTYLGETTQLTGQSNGTLGTAWGYYPNAQDRRLMSVATTGGTTYGLSWTDEMDLTGLTDSTNNLSWTYTYDTADRLKTATATGLSYSYNYDAASNLGPIQRPQGTATIIPNAVNQVTSVNGVASIYDANGNLLKDYARTYAWDADNRLIGVGIIGQAGLQTNFKYDGVGRRIAIDTTSGGTTTETRYQWCGETLCQARSSSDVVARRYFTEGENAVVLSQVLYYGVDQLGSVRDALTVSSGGVAAHYDYEPYGTQSNTALATTDFKYGGLFYNQQTNLSLGTYRAYDSLTGRWIARDPVGELGGLNLYSYAGSNPAVGTDASGRCLEDFCIGEITFAAVRCAANPSCVEAISVAGTFIGTLAVTGSFRDALENAGIVSMSMIGSTPCAGASEAGEASNVGGYLAKKAPFQIAPGVSNLSGQYVNDLGRIEPWSAYYDEYGRMIGRTDYNAGNVAAGIPTTHYHTYEYGPGMNPFESGQHIPGEYPGGFNQ